MSFASTSLEIKFDDMNTPKQLIMHKMCVAAPMSDESAVKIELWLERALVKLAGPENNLLSFILPFPFP